MSDWLGDLVAKVETVVSHASDRPAQRTLHRLFEVMYLASLRTEESQPIAFHLVYINPASPDPSPPRRIVQDRWSYVPLQPHLPFDTATVTKIAKASDPRSSSLAVYHDSAGELFVWGLIDQGNSYFDFVNYDVESGPERPGLFQASIAGVGHLTVYRRYELIADLRFNELRPPPIDALTRGPIHEALLPGIRNHLDAVRAGVGDPAFAQRGHWTASLSDRWLTALRRLLLRIQQYRHGGAVLITPDISDDELNVKYRIDYLRLKTCLERRGVFGIRYAEASDEIFEMVEDHAEEIPVDLYFDESVADRDLEESRDELDGILWFVSLLSRVDGLVLLSPDLSVRGFGVEILTNVAPMKVVRALEPRAVRTKVAPLNYNHFGTRHRSMMRYCAKVAGSVGFVVSQDGDVRAMTRVRDTLAVWDNVKLRLDDFERRRRRQKSASP
jgi:hypothetical protein